MTPMTGTYGMELTGDIRLSAVVEACAEYSLVLADRFPLCLKTVIDGVFDADKGFDLQVTVGASVNVSGSI